MKNQLGIHSAILCIFFHFTYTFICVCVCVCVCEREREREHNPFRIQVQNSSVPLLWWSHERA